MWLRLWEPSSTSSDIYGAASALAVHDGQGKELKEAHEFSAAIPPSALPLSHLIISSMGSGLVSTAMGNLPGKPRAGGSRAQTASLCTNWPLGQLLALCCV